MSFDWSGFGAVAGGLGSIWSGIQQQKTAKDMAAAIRYATDRQFAQTEELTRPWIEQAKFALPRLRTAILSQLAPEVGQENPYLRTAHETNVQGIERGTRSALAESARYWGRTGNVSKARGERLQIERGGQETTSAENLRYGSTQKSYKDTRLDRYMAALGQSAGVGTSALGPALRGIEAGAGGAVSAAQVGAGASSDLYGDLGDVFGSLIGDWMDRQAEKRAEERAEKKKGP